MLLILLVAAPLQSLRFTATSAQATPAAATPGDKVALYQALLDLANPWTVMCIAAHPDDEDGTSLIVLRHKYGVHTVSLFSTFGEGGQNAIGPELYEELGAIRARETMAAAEIQGSEPHFLGLKDFGYSKSADEAFKFWGHDEALRRMVLQIRKLRPDVIITNHSVTNRDHGHHQATARLELEAFDAAADSKRFPEQLQDGVTTWQVQRLFVRAGRSNQAQAENSGVVSIDPNERDPLRGVVYAEEALRALQQHVTQGPWPKTFAEFAARFRSFSGQSAAPGQLPQIRYVLVREAKGAAPLPNDSHNFLEGLRLTADATGEMSLLKLAGSPIELSSNRSQALAQLIKGFRQGSHSVPFDHAADSQRLSRMWRRMDRAFALAAGIDFKIEPATEIVIPNSTVDISIRISNSGTEPVNVLGCESWAGSSEPTSLSKQARDRVIPGAAVKRSDKVRIAADTPINIPVSDHLYEPSGLGVVLSSRCTIEMSGANFAIDLPVRVDVAPRIEIAGAAPSPLVLSPAKEEDRESRTKIPFTVTLINHQPLSFNGHLKAYEGTFGNPIDEMAVKLAAGEKRTVRFMVAPPGLGVVHDSVTFFLQEGKLTSPPKTVRTSSTGARVIPNVRVAYIRGFDFSLPNALTALGVESKELSVDEVKTTDLQKYNAIIVDNRVYESQPELIAANQRLLDYAKDGGTLIVFYHKSNEWNPDPRRNRPQLAPYPITLNDERVTDENAPVIFIEPEHPLLNTPNKIGQEDFADWIQERGLYYPKTWDEHYHALLATNDPGEQPLRGGLLAAEYGRGHYIYTSMVWYRQLRAGVPGGYRMLANMISYGR